MINAVLDSNVLLSGFVRTGRPGSPPAELIRHWRAGSFELVCSEPIIDEVERTLAKPYFRRRVTPSESRRLVALLGKRSRKVELTVEVASVATHPEDDLVLATAVSANVDYLVTGDGPLQTLAEYRLVRIVSPRVFLELLTARSA